MSRQSTFENPVLRIDAAAIREALDRDALRVATALLGEPNRALSSKHDIRFGSRGSLSLKGGVFFDHEAGIGGGMLDLIRHRLGCDFPAALRYAADLVGGVEPLPPPGRKIAAPSVRATGDFVMPIWHETKPLCGSLGERYLAGRGLSAPESARDLRFHPACPHHDGRAPAMVAAMRDIRSNEIVGLHRTFLQPDATKISGTAKLMLGRSKGAAIKLCDDAEVTLGLALSEGIETGLALLAFGVAPVWPLGSAGGIRSFPVLPGIEALTIAVDNDRSGTGDVAARECGIRWREAGREVRLIRSPIAGEDVADLLPRAA